jgi:hypothetical protein
MANGTFDELLQWLQNHDGQSVNMEIGADDPHAGQPVNAVSVAMHVAIEGIQSATNLDLPGRMAVVVQLGGGERNRLYLEQERILKILIHDGVKIWFVSGFYIGLS